MFLLRNKSRQCGNCTQCCQGWLSGNAYGSKFYPGRPCSFLGSRGCNIYPSRPYNPCQTFECKWKRTNTWPEWLRPDQSNLIFLDREHEKQAYIRGFSTKKPAKKEIFEWAKTFALETEQTIVIPRECIGYQMPADGKKYTVSVYGTNEIVKNYYALMYHIVN